MHALFHSYCTCKENIVSKNLKVVHSSKTQFNHNRLTNRFCNLLWRYRHAWFCFIAVARLRCCVKLCKNDYRSESYPCHHIFVLLGVDFCRPRRAPHLPLRDNQAGLLHIFVAEGLCFLPRVPRRRGPVRHL